MNSVLTINNIVPDVHFTALEREATILNGSNTGQLKNGTIVRDVIGSIYNYGLEVAPKINNLPAYDNLYQIVTAPTESYTVSLPFGQGALEFTGYINSASDELIYTNSLKKLWDKLNFTVIATEPQRYYGESPTATIASSNTVFTIDDIGFDINIINLKRTGKVQDTSDFSRLLSGITYREIIGTYYNYKMELEINLENVDEYDKLYYKLTAPVDSHRIVVPYGQSTLTFDAYISSVSDKLTFLNDDKKIWSGLEVEFIAMAPERT